MEFSSATDFQLKRFVIYKSSSTDFKAKDGLDIKKLVESFEYVESILNPFLLASATIVDSSGLIGSLPIKGGERVVIQVMTSIGNAPIEYDMVVWNVSNRYALQKKQT